MDGIFLDIETTGLNPAYHVPIEIAFKVIDLASGKEKATYSAIIKQPEEEWKKKDPSSIGVNGFTWEEITRGKESAVIGKEIFALLSTIPIQRGRAVFICQNPSFDRGFFNQLVDVYIQESLQWPYHWLDLASMFWARRVLEWEKLGESIPEQMTLSKNAIARFYRLPEEQEPHRAMGGVDHLIQCYHAVVNS